MNEETKSKFSPPGWMVYPLLLICIILAVLYFFGNSNPAAVPVAVTPDAPLPKTVVGGTAEAEAIISQTVPQSNVFTDRRAPFIEMCQKDLEVAAAQPGADASLEQARQMAPLFCACTYDTLHSNNITPEQMSDEAYMEGRIMKCVLQTKKNQAQAQSP